MCDRVQELPSGDDSGYDSEQVQASRLKMAVAKSSLAQTGCTDINQLVTECLDKNNREWRYCQSETKALRECMKQNAAQAAAAEAQASKQI